MPVRTTLSFTERHHKFMISQVDEGIYATQSAVVAVAVEALIEQKAAREAALVAMADEIRGRFATPREEFVGEEEAFAGLDLENDTAGE